MECDRQGQIVWLSPAARPVLGDAVNLADAIRLGLLLTTEKCCQGREEQEKDLCFSLVLETGARRLFSAQLRSLADRERREEMGLVSLQDNFVRHCFRLQDAERSLSTLARSMHPGSGRRIVLQVERERQRVGRELHTGVGQMLVAIRSQLETVMTQLPAPPQAVGSALDRAFQLLADALDQLRSVSRKLHPPEWLRLTIDEALRQLWDLSAINTRYQGRLELAELAHEPELETKILIYRAAQEALSNFTQHSQGTRIDMTLAVREGRLVLTARDNGVGFDVGARESAPAQLAGGIGLRSIREQALAVGGTMTMRSDSTGTTLEIAAPYAT